MNKQDIFCKFGRHDYEYHVFSDAVLLEKCKNCHKENRLLYLKKGKYDGDYYDDVYDGRYYYNGKTYYDKKLIKEK